MYQPNAWKAQAVQMPETEAPAVMPLPCLWHDRIEVAAGEIESSRVMVS